MTDFKIDDIVELIDNNISNKKITSMAIGTRFIIFNVRNIPEKNECYCECYLQLGGRKSLYKIPFHCLAIYVPKKRINWSEFRENVKVPCIDLVDDPT